jgi:ferredoxin/hemoglobin-like flavoprotein/tRNA A-37 threonylcarbamoyl transferase component Bud32
MKTTIGKYSILAKIGQGAMGEVYRAQDTVLGRLVALKTIAASAAVRWDDTLAERFRREAQAAAGLNHPNVVTVYDFGEHDGTFYLVMELLEGSDLGEVLRRRTLTRLEDKLAVLEQIFDGIGFAHARKIVHRDLKPANIHLAPSGTAKIMDFGLARTGDLEVTRSGGVLGTPYYMSPEQVRGERVDARSDVFSLGALSYELLTGHRAFPAENIHAVLFQVLEREPDPLRSLDPSIPQSLEVLVRKALAKEPDRRFQDAGEMRDALRRVRAVLAGEASEAEVLAGFGVQAGAGGSLSLSSPFGSSAGPSLGSGALRALDSTHRVSQPCRITFREAGGDRVAEISNQGLSILDAAQRSGVPLFHECGGRGRCTTCRVRVLAGAAHVQPRTAVEARLASRYGWGDEIRLGCQTRVTGDVEVQRLILDDDDFSLLRFEKKQPTPVQETALAVLVCSLRSFAPFARKAPPYDVIHLLNRFYLQVGEPILANGGTIQKYLDAGMVALFGLGGGDAREKCLSAVRTALRMRARMEELERYARTHLGAELGLSLSLHFGRSIVGPVGHPSRMEITALGDLAATADWLAATPHDPSLGIVATEDAINVIEDDVQLGRTLHEERNGREITLYEVVDFRKADAVWLTQVSFEEVARRKQEAGELFYQLLFEIDPGIRRLFEGADLRVQADMLMSMLGAAIKGLDRMEDLRPTLEDLGRRHAGYGVELRHYDMVEQALIETIRRMLGPGFTMDVRLAWSRIYNEIARIMLDASEGAAA